MGKQIGTPTRIIRDSYPLFLLLKDAYAGTDKRKRSCNFHLRLEQDELLEDLARFNGDTKVAMLRAIIDEWRELRMGDYSE